MQAKQPGRQLKGELLWTVDEEDDDRTEDPQERTERRVKTVAADVLRMLTTDRLNIPMLPQAATEAMQLASDPTTSFKTIERVVSGDPLLAARVLAVANSPLYGGQNIRSLARALQRLGTGTLRDILYQAVAEAHIFRGDEGTALENERHHGVCVGLAARAVCKRVGLDSGYAFVCGLLHDLGRPVLLTLLRANRPESLTPVELGLVIDRLHSFFGAHLAATWSLPKLVAEACRRHHAYHESEKRPYSQIGNAIAVADRLANHQGAGRSPRPISLTADRAYYDLGLAPGDVQEMLLELQEQSNAA